MTSPRADGKIVGLISHMASKSSAPERVIAAGGEVYLFLQTAAELEGRQLPRVSAGTCNAILHDYKRGSQYLTEVLRKVGDETPDLADLIADHSKRAGSNQNQRFVLETGLLVYAMVSREVEAAELEKGLE